MVTTDIPSLRPRVTGEVENEPGIGNFIYWRLPNGWISYGPAHADEWQRRTVIGHVPLPQYGQFPYARKATDANGQRWDAKAEPWRMFFQRGGVKELCLEQIIAHNWHIRPPYREVVFPQLEGVYYETYECPDCTRSVFTSLEEGYAPFVLNTHLRMGHGWSRAEVAEYGRELGLKFRRARHAQEPRKVETPALTEDVDRDEKFKCACGWAPLKTAKRPDTALMWHKKKCKVAP